ncbi:hypothetical protein STEG23_007068 [Scotinomys teguina]
MGGRGGGQSEAARRRSEDVGVTGMRFGIFSLFFCACCSQGLVTQNAEDCGEILLIRHLNPAILICVMAFEYVGQPLQNDAAPNEVIKCHLPSSLTVKFLEEDVMELIREPVAKA